MDKSVYGIQNEPFATRTKEEQLQIIREGKPRPELSIPPSFESGDGADKFDLACYDTETWLTACDKRNTFYCWTCLLFASDSKSDWVTNGFGDYRNLHESTNRHKLITDHINAELQFHLFVRENLSEMSKVDNPLPNDLVGRNRVLLRRVLDVVYYTATRSPHPPKNATASRLGAYIRGSCVDALSLCRSYDPDDVAEDAVRLVEGTRLLTDVVKTLATMVRLRIKEQMRGCRGVSLILSEHSDVSTSSRLSVVLRYAGGGRVHERFAGFVLLKRDGKDADSVGECVTEVLSLYEIEQKLVAFSCDGATLPTSQLERLLRRIRSSNAGGTRYFVPCHFHPFDVVLEQSMSQHVMGALFFKTLASIRDCLHGNRKMADAFADSTVNACALKDVFVDPTVSNWDFAMSVRPHRKAFVDFFKHVVQEPEEWSDDDVVRSMGIYKLLEEFEMAFMFELVSGIYSYSEGLIDAMRGRCPEDVFDSNQVENVLNNLKRVGLKDFPRIWDLTCIEMGSAVGQLADRLQADGTLRSCRKLFEVMMTKVRSEFEIRLRCRGELDFFQYLSDGSQRRCEASRPVRACGRLFDDVDRLNKEIAAVEWLILSKPLHEVYEILSSESLRGAFGMVCELAEIVLTMPCKAVADAEEEEETDAKAKASDGDTSSGESVVPPKRKSTKLDVIRFWSTMVSPVTNDWGVICIEQDILKCVMSEEQFFGEFLLRFQILSSALQLA